jgi:hypothetical protein
MDRTAQVFLRSALGASLRNPTVPVTAETVARYRPTAATVRQAKRLLQKAGFEVLETLPTLGITGSAALFETHFQIPVHVATREVPEAVVPVAWRNVIEGIVLTEPPELFP